VSSFFLRSEADVSDGDSGGNTTKNKKAAVLLAGDGVRLCGAFNA
jgi:hypothetical protein